MTMDELRELFADDSNFLRDDPSKPLRHRRKDIAAFLLLDELVPGKYDMVTAAEHDQIWLDVEPAALALCVSPEQVTELQRCGVMLDTETDSLSMFV